METLELLKELGMTKASDALGKKLDKQRKLFTAYQNFRFVNQEAIESFNKNLREKTEIIYDKNTKEVRKKVDPKKWNEIVYDKLVFSKLSEYKDVPPTDVLLKVKEAVDLKCFDTFEVAKIESVKEVVDPIIFGSIEGCSDKFFIAQWDEDVKFEDILKEQSNGFNI